MKYKEYKEYFEYKLDKKLEKKSKLILKFYPKIKSFSCILNTFTQKKTWVWVVSESVGNLEKIVFNTE